MKAIWRYIQKRKDRRAMRRLSRKARRVARVYHAIKSGNAAML